MLLLHISISKYFAKFSISKNLHSTSLFPCCTKITNITCFHFEKFLFYIFNHCSTWKNAFSKNSCCTKSLTNITNITRFVKFSISKNFYIFNYSFTSRNASSKHPCCTKSLTNITNMTCFFKFSISKNFYSTSLIIVPLGKMLLPNILALNT